MADVDLKLSERAGSAATCVFCKEPLGAASVSCPGCGVGLHAACRDEASRCPTLGCGQAWERRASAAAAARTHATPLEGFRPIIRGTGERGPELTGESSKLRLLALLLFGLFVAAFAVIRWVESAGASRLDARGEAARARAAQVDAETRRAANPELAGREGAMRAEAARIAATPLVVAGDEAAVWRAGTLHTLGQADGQDRDPGLLLLPLLRVSGNYGLRLEDARWLVAGLRQRVLAALPAPAADAWAQHPVGSSARVRLVFHRVEHGAREGRPFEARLEAGLDATLVLTAVRDDAIDLRVTVTHMDAPVSWSETWPRALDPALRLSVLTLTDDPASTVVLQRISRPVRAVTAAADGVTLQVFHEDGLPLPWHATSTRDVDGQRSYRVELELLEWRPAS